MAVNDQMAHVYVASCRDYDPEAIAEHVRAAASTLGVALPASGSAILHASIPFSHHRFAPDARTHPEVIDGVARTLAGTSLTLGGQSLPGLPTRFSLGTAGYRDLTRRIHAGLAPFDERPFQAVAVPGAPDGVPIEISRVWLGASFRVAVPRLMGSTFMPFSGALLHSLALLPQRTQSTNHHLLPELLLPIATAAKPDLIVVDAIQATHKGGEISGEAVDLGLLVIGTDPVAVDLVCAAAYGVPDAEMAFVAGPAGEAAVKTVGDVEIVGDVDLAELRRRGSRVERMDPNPENYPLPKKLTVVRSDKSRLAGSAGSLTEALAVIERAGWSYEKSRQVALVLGAVDDIPKGTTDKSTVIFIGDTARGETEGYSRVVRLVGRNATVSQILMDLPFLLDIGNFRTDLGAGFTIARIRAGLARALGRSGSGTKAAAGPRREGGGGAAQ